MKTQALLIFQITFCRSGKITRTISVDMYLSSWQKNYRKHFRFSIRPYYMKVSDQEFREWNIWYKLTVCKIFPSKFWWIFFIGFHPICALIRSEIVKRQGPYRKRKQTKNKKISRLELPIFFINDNFTVSGRILNYHHQQIYLNSEHVYIWGNQGNIRLVSET